MQRPHRVEERSVKEPTIWGIHAGKFGNADKLFKEQEVIAIGWAEMGDLSKLAANKDAFKAALAQTYPDKLAAVPVNTGQLFRFVYEMAEGDLVLYSSAADRKVHFGRVNGSYRHDPSHLTHYPNRRPVKWLKAVPRTHFTQGALHELGSAMTLFQVKNYADEFRTALEGNTGPTAGKPEKDLTVGPVAQDIEDTTRDFILKTLAQELKGHPLADFVAHLLNTMSYRTRVSPPGTDGGVDILAHRDELGFEPPIIKVQVKSIEGSIGDPVVSALYGKVGPGEHGLLVTLGTFTNQAISFAKSKSNLRLIDGKELVDLILAHYEQFEPRYKGILPLKRVYIPEPISDGG